MVKRLFLILLVVMMIPSTVVMASDVSGALYSATVRATNTSYTAQRVAVPFTLSTEALIDGHYINSSVNNLAIQDSAGNDMVFMPAPPGSDDFVMYIPQISQNSSVNYRFYTGGSDMSPSISYFPASTGMTTTDASSMEPGDDFEIIIDGYIDTSAGVGKYLVSKDGALSLYVSDNEELTLEVYIDSYIPDTVYLVPNGAGASNTFTGTYADINDPVGTPDDDSTYINNPDYNQTKTGYFATTDPTIPAGSVITSVKVFYRHKVDGIGTSTTYPRMYLGGNYSEGAGQNPGSSWSSHTVDFTSNRPGGGSWSIADFADLQVGIRNASVSGDDKWITQAYIIVDYGYPDTLSLTAADIESGEHEVKIEADGTDLNLYVDDVLENTVALAGSSIIDSSADWEYCLNNSVVYLNSLETYVSDSLVQQIEWEYDTTFSDASGSGNDATPAFRATSTDADVSATLLGFGVIAESEVDYDETGTAPLITSAPDEPAQAYGDMDINFPGAAVINTILDTGRFPQELFWYPLLFGLSAVTGMVAFHITRSVMMQSLISGTGIAISTLGILQADFWVLIPYVIISLALITQRKTVSL